MSIYFILRIIGMIVFSAAGYYWGTKLPTPEQVKDTPYFFSILLSVIGALLGLIITPYITIMPMKKIKSLVRLISGETLVAGFFGLVIGLLIATLLTNPISLLPDPFGKILPFVIMVFSSYLSIYLFVMRKEDIFNVIRSFSSGEGRFGRGDHSHDNQKMILLDTSVIIDGRVADIARTGFLPGFLNIPRFVLNELQFVADSSDSLRRQRGRRGMAVLAELQKIPSVKVSISDLDADGIKEVDEKLVVLAKQLKCPILTNDYNLNRVAELQGVSVLNINELANAVKMIVLPGELLAVAIIQEGKESNQGVGYMDDGTMVVVDGGNKFIGTTKQVSVTKVLQTAAGKMIFGKIEND